MKTFLIVTLCFCAFFNFGLADLPNIELPNIDEIGAIKDRCDSVGGNGTYDKVKEARTSATTCLQGLVNYDEVKNELEEAKKTGSMDEVFGKYCKKRSQVKDCAQNFIDNVKLCLNDDERNSLNITIDILIQLGDFACFRDGDRLAMFVAEGGIECIKDHAEGIQRCINSTFQIGTESITAGSIPNLLIDEKKCADLGRLQTCVVEDLEKCKESTPANIVDALFRFIKRSACPKKNKRSIRRMMKRSNKIHYAPFIARDIAMEIF